MYCALCVLAGLQQTASKRRRVKNVQSRERSHFLPSPFGPCPQLNINTKKYKYRKKYKHKTGKRYNFLLCPFTSNVVVDMKSLK